jgi:hypothetical protein
MRRAILAGQVLPAAACDQDVDVQDAFECPTVVGAGTASTCWRRKEWPDERPLLLSQRNPAHASRLVHPASVWEPPLDKLWQSAPLFRIERLSEWLQVEGFLA